MAPDTGSNVEVDVWDAQVASCSELLRWAYAHAGRVLWGHGPHPDSCEARIVGQPALFSYSPAAWGSYDTVQLVFGSGQQTFRITFTSHATPMLPGEVAIFKQMLDSFALPGAPADGIVLPGGWEQGAGLFSDTVSVQAPAELPPAQLLPYREGLMGTVTAWSEDGYGFRFTLKADDGHSYDAQIGEFRRHFRGLPLDWVVDVDMPAPQPGDRILVLGQPLVDGGVRVEYLAVERQAAWRTWFRKRLFELGSDQLDPLLLDRYVSTPPAALKAPDLWLLGTVQQVLPLVVAVDGNPLAPGAFTARLEDRALAYGVLDKPGSLQVRLVRLFVQDESECVTWDHWEHCPHWTELYPPGTPAPSTGPTSVPAVTPAGVNDGPVLFTVPVGPDGVQYGAEQTGPMALAVATDGTFWIADTQGNRLLHYDSQGVQLNRIDLNGHGIGVADMEAIGSDVLALVVGYGEQVLRFNADGNLLATYDIPGGLGPEGGLTGLAVGDHGQVLLEFEMGAQVAQLVDAQGALEPSPLPGYTHDGQLYKTELAGWQTSRGTIVAGSARIEVTVPDTLAGLRILGFGPAGNLYAVVDEMVSCPTVWVNRTVRLYGPAGDLLGVARVPLAEGHTFVQNGLAVGPDGCVYALLTHPDRVEVVRLHFSSDP